MRSITVGLLGASLALAAGLAMSGPEEDRQAFVKYHQARYPNTPFDEFANGIYAIDASRREEWKQMEEFAQYELDIDAGEEAFNKPFANGETYASCFPDYRDGIKQNYPYFDTELGEVMTLEWAINRCRERNGEKPLRYGRGELAQISAYLAYLSRGKLTHVVIPDDPRALAAYENGKQFYYSKRGQLNFSCANCHLQAGGMNIRANRLSPALGQTSHWPVYRKKWGGIGTLQRRYRGCNGQVRAAGFKLQGPEYRNLEYFHTYMSNGIPLNGPGGRE